MTLSLSNPIFQGINFKNQQLSTLEISGDNIFLYPNPVQNKLTIENPDLKVSQVKITDVNGKLVLSQKINSVKTVLGFSKIQKGVYFVTVLSGDKIIRSEKLIKN